MRFLVACDSFKESCSAQLACESIAHGLRAELSSCEIDVCPLADGGEGTIDVVRTRVAMDLERVPVLGPLGEPLQAWVAWERRQALSPLADPSMEPYAWLEAASCVGLGLVPQPRRNPLNTSSYGLGQLILHAHRRGAKRLVVALGGTSTVDAGLGLAQALGVRIAGVEAPAGGGALRQVQAIELHSLEPLRNQLQVLLASDVNNPLLGDSGAAKVYGPQKGASPHDVELLECGIEHYARLLWSACSSSASAGSPSAGSVSASVRADKLDGSATAERRSFEHAASVAGAGAAGGLGFALEQLLGATWISGVELVMQCVDFEQRLVGADYVVTGEGRLDPSSFSGKVVSGVVARANASGIPVAVICGSSALPEGTEADHRLARVVTLLEHARDLEDAKSRAPELLFQAARELANNLLRHPLVCIAQEGRKNERT